MERFWLRVGVVVSEGVFSIAGRSVDQLCDPRMALVAMAWSASALAIAILIANERCRIEATDCSGNTE